VVPTFWHFLGAWLVRKVTQDVSEVGTSGLANPDTITVQKEVLKWQWVTQLCHKVITEVIKKVSKEEPSKFGGAVPYLPKMGKWAKACFCGFGRVGGLFSFSSSDA